MSNHRGTFVAMQVVLFALVLNAFGVAITPPKPLTWVTLFISAVVFDSVYLFLVSLIAGFIEEARRARRSGPEEMIAERRRQFPNSRHRLG